MSKDKRDLSSMADLLRSGAVMLSLSCPACSAPIFKLKSGDLWCEKCRKKVVHNTDEQKTELESLTHLNNVESTCLSKIQEINTLIQDEEDPLKLERLAGTLQIFLENLEKILRLKNHTT